MDDFKDSTKTHYSCGGRAYAKGGAVKGAAKVAKVMGDFKRGGDKPVKKAGGGRMMREGVSTRPVTATGRPISNEELNTPASVLAAAKRAERMQALEAREEAKLMRRPRDPREPLLKRKAGGLAAMPRGKKC